MKIEIASIAPLSVATSRSIRTILQQTLAEERESNTYVSLSFVDEQTIRNLNQTFRGLDKATNVLSFPGSFEPITPHSKFKDLGEIIICADYALIEAQKANMDPEVRLAHLIIHGALHLLGYDHEISVEDQARMEKKEHQLLVNLPEAIFSDLSSLITSM